MSVAALSLPLSLPERIADLAVRALIDEAELTPKPGLVDQRGNGAHHDLTLPLMRRSAQALHSGFIQMGRAASLAAPGIALRETLGQIGRDAETTMLLATGGVNTHRGAIWALGLLSAAAAMDPADWQADHLAQRAAQLARLPDQYSLPRHSNGEKVCARYGVKGARGEAAEGFPHVVDVALPALQASRAAGGSETCARLDALLAVMTTLDDTCVLSRGGEAALRATQQLAQAVLQEGGTATPQGWEQLARLDHTMLTYRASPGGAADLLAATLLVDALEQSRYRFNEEHFDGNHHIYLSGHHARQQAGTGGSCRLR